MLLGITKGQLWMSCGMHKNASLARVYRGSVTGFGMAAEGSVNGSLLKVLLLLLLISVTVAFWSGRCVQLLSCFCSLGKEFITCQPWRLMMATQDVKGSIFLWRVLLAGTSHLPHFAISCDLCETDSRSTPLRRILCQQDTGVLWLRPCPRENS
jgi:hypothetical protein